MKNRINYLAAFFLIPNSVFINRCFLIFNLAFIILFLSCSKESTKPETVTFSGKVTLEGRTDHSGVKVSLYKPVALDTALVRINQQYPNIGVQISQETEFDHREHTPVYSTTTNATGNWKIENVTPGDYNVVAEKDSFGWKTIFKTSGTQHNMNFKNTINLNQIDFSQNNIVIPPESYVQIVQNLLLNKNVVLTIGEGSIVEFKNNSELQIEGEFILNGSAKARITVYGGSNSSSRIQMGSNSKATFQYVNFQDFNSSLYLKGANAITIKYCRFKKGANALESVQTAYFKMENCIITDMEDGLLLNHTHSELYKNIISKITKSGILSLNEKNAVWKNNIISYCLQNGLAMNPEGYGYSDSWAEIQQNDFVKNYNHIILGNKGWCRANQNNFLDESNYILMTSAIIGIDSLNFKTNYWKYVDKNMISEKIMDGHDRIGQPNVGCFVNYSDYRTNYINWQ
ncbi:MAG: hypothetical protein Kow0042_28370 [Calditrichia bacterium]